MRYQYDDAEKFRIRVEAHERYSEQTGGFREWLLVQIAPSPGLSLLDTGCGPGTYHPALATAGSGVTACDVSAGMLREAVAQSVEQALAIVAVRASAEALPFADESFDIVMANHMLYHVPDQHQALRELHRVLRPGGHAIFATNDAANCARLDALHEQAARSLGYVPAVSDALRFTLDDLELVRTAFPSAQVLARHDAFLFPDPASAVRYYASYHIDAIQDRPADGRHRSQLARLVGEAIEEVITREGVFRVPKVAGATPGGASRPVRRPPPRARGPRARR